MIHRASLSDILLQLGQKSTLSESLNEQLESLLEGSTYDLSSVTTSLSNDFISQNKLDKLETLIKILRDHNFTERAQALRSYVELEKDKKNNPPLPRLQKIAQILVSHAHNKNALEATKLSAVFTAHPTFSLDNHVYTTLAQLAENPHHPLPCLPTHRRSAPPTLDEEQNLALEAIIRGRDALDKLNGYIFNEVAHSSHHAHQKIDLEKLTPAPITVASWVGFDTDGRNDIGWWDTIRIRLELKIAQITRLQTGLEKLYQQIKFPQSYHSSLLERIKRALIATQKQHHSCPRTLNGQIIEPDLIANFSRILVEERENALLNAKELLPFFEAESPHIPADKKQEFNVLRTSFITHGLSIAHIHTRLNAAQIYNVARIRLGLTDDPTLPSHRRVLLSRIDEAMSGITPLKVDFGSLLIEPSAAARLMMTMAQILKHIDHASPIRFLIAETESGYTLLATLWLARLFGIEDHQIEISPLFETETALENGETILEEAFQSPHWRDYLRANGRLSLQFGYSDSGRYIGQIAAGTLVERLRLRALSLMKHYGLDDIALTMFDTHGESIGRGAHPFSIKKRLSYFSPPHTRHELHKAGISSRVETAFQGGDGYALFGTDIIAASTIASLGEYIIEADDNASIPQPDPLYQRPEFAADFFSTIAMKMDALVNDPGYTALLSAFGPSLIDKTGSRPSARQSDTATITRITHPSQIRAIPNNAILQQLGWWANILHGLGEAANRHPDLFMQLRQTSPRFEQLMDFAIQALKHSDLDVLRETIRHLDPGTWLDRASHSKNEEERACFMTIAEGFETLGFWKTVPAMFRRIQCEDIALRSIWSNAPQMAGSEKLLHLIRFALMEHIWKISTYIPYFGPRGTITREAITNLILCLDIPQALHLLDDLFPIKAPNITDLDFGEIGDAAVAQGFAREHREIFIPLQKSFDLLREIGIAIMHANHSFG